MLADIEYQSDIAMEFYLIPDTYLKCVDLFMKSNSYATIELVQFLHFIYYILMYLVFVVLFMKEKNVNYPDPCF